MDGTPTGPGGWEGSPSALALALLDEVARGRNPVRAVRHPLGFFCLPMRRERGDGVCVHLFTTHGAGVERATSTTSRIHCHSWDLTSHVLYGRVENVRVTVSEEPRSATHRLYRVDSGPDGDEIRPTGRLVSAEPGVPSLSVRGETYTLPAGVFHTTGIPRGQETATLVFGRGRAGGADLSLGPLDGTGHRVVRDICGPEETARLVRAASRLVEEPGRAG